MMQGRTITQPYCQPTLHAAQLAGMELVTRYKNVLYRLTSRRKFGALNRHAIALRLAIVRLGELLRLPAAMRCVKSP